VSRLGRLWKGAVHTWEVCREAEERRQLMCRPWEEQILHWSRQEDGWVLHGEHLPPDARWRYGSTKWGWCPRSDG
jgi:hypothetical protein